MDYLENKKRLEELEALETKLVRDLEAKQIESAEALISNRDFDLSEISHLGARLGQTRRGIEILERRIASFRRGEGR